MFGGKLFVFISILVVAAMLATSLTGAVPARLAAADAPVTTLVEEWRYALQPGTDLMRYGASPGIADLGPDVNNKGQEPDSDLEIVSGSDEFSVFYPDLGVTARGAWRVYDSGGNVEWARPTESDEARSSVAIDNLAGDGNLEIVGGTTSGWNVEMMDRLGNFIWTYPSPPATNGPFMWHSSPAIAQVSSPGYTGKLVIEGARLPYPPFGGGAAGFSATLNEGSQPRAQDVTMGGSMWAFDADNSDGIDEGVHIPDLTWYPNQPGGVEGVDWDVIWYYNTPGSVISTPAVADIDGDGDQEVVFGTGYSMGSAEGAVYALDAATGALEWTYQTDGTEVTGSAALADFDGDGLLEVVIGSSYTNFVYFIKGDRNGNGVIDPDEVTSFGTAGGVYSSAAVGDIDNDGALEAVIGSFGGTLYALGYDPGTNSATLKWSAVLGGDIIGSPALADRTAIATYARPWPFFRANVQRTGVYGGPAGNPLGVYVTSTDGKLYLLDGATGNVLADFQTNGPIYTSPSVADVDGDNKLEIFFYDNAGSVSYGNQDTFWAIEDTMSSAPPPTQWFWKAGGWVDYAPSGVPDFDSATMDWQTSASGPMAVANSLWWFDSKFEPSPVPPPQVNDNYPLVPTSTGIDDHDPANVLPFADYLAGLMDTDGQTSGSGHAGTRILDMASAVRAYLDERGLGNAYTVHLVPKPDFPWVAGEVERSEDVVLLLGFWQLQPVVGASPRWVRLGGNFVTVAGVSTEAGQIAFSDPLRDAAEAGGSGHVPVAHPAPHDGAAHADAQFVSHDIYGVTSTDSPGGVWGPANYELFNFQQLTQVFGANVPRVFEEDQGYLGEGIVVTEVEYALAVSPATGPGSPLAGFTADVTSGPVPLDVQFTDQSNGNVNVNGWLWDFNGDGVVDSSDQNPAHTYSAPGVYSVLLTVNGPDGADTEVKVEYITVTGDGQSMVEVDTYPNSLIETTLVTPTGGPVPLVLFGPTTVQVYFEGPAEGDAVDDDGDGRDDVLTEMVQLSLTGTSPTLGPVQVNLNPFTPSQGQIVENANNTPGRLDVPPFAPSGMADSFFDVFFEIQVGGQTLHNEAPLLLDGVLRHKPAAPGDSYESPFQVPLLDAAGIPTGFFLGLTTYTPNPAPEDAVEVDTYPNSLLETTLVTPTGGPVPLVLFGPTTVEVFFEGPTEGDAVDDDGDGRDDVLTEMVQLSLTGTSPTLGPVQVNLNPFTPSQGQIVENANNTPGRLDVPPFAPSGMADSFFDVFFEIQVGGQTLHNEAPLLLDGVLRNKPAAPGDSYESPFQVPLLDAAGFPTGFFLGLTKYTPNPAPEDAVEVDTYPNSLLETTLVTPTGGPVPLTLTGPTTVDVYFEGPTEGDAADDDGDGRDDLLTEMVQLNLTGVSPTLGAVQVNLNPTPPSSGQIEENANNTPGRLDLPPFAPSGMADSFFDVFVEVEIGGQTLHNSVPLSLYGTLNHKPAAPGDFYESTGQIPLLDASGNPTGFYLGLTRYTPVPAPASGAEGVVKLQGRSDRSGVSVSGGGETTLTDPAGHFFLPLPNGTYDVTASMPGYLPATYAGAVVGGVLTLPPVNLRGGDGDNDGDVDLADLALFVVHFTGGVGGSCCDINNDGDVGLEDLTIMGMNFSNTTTPWSLLD